MGLRVYANSKCVWLMVFVFHVAVVPMLGGEGAVQPPGSSAFPSAQVLTAPVVRFNVVLVGYCRVKRERSRLICVFLKKAFKD